METRPFLARCLKLAILIVLAVCPKPSKAAVKDVNCAGTTADATTINNAIAASNVGDDIRIHGNGRTCLINATIVLLPDRTYEGDSRTGTVIQQTNGANLRAMLASQSWNSSATDADNPIRVAHLRLNGNKAANTGTAALVIRSWLTIVEDLYIENAPADGIVLTNLGKNNNTMARASGGMVGGRISQCFITDSGGNGIRVVDTQNNVTDWDLIGNAVAASGQSAIYLDNAAGWRITGNHVYGDPQYGIFADRSGGTTIDQNYVEDFGSSGGAANTWYGIACTIQGDGATVISGNKIFQFNGEPASGSFVYVGIIQVNYGTGVVSVVNNIINGASGVRDTALSYQLGGGTALKILSANNNVHAAGTPRSVGTGVTLAQGY